MNDYQVSASGAVVYWSAGPTNRDLLNARLEALGLGEFQPTERTDDSALQCALKDHCDAANKLRRRDNRDKIVQRRKKRKNGFEVVDVERGEARNYYTTDFGVKLGENGELIVDHGYANAHELRELFDRHKGILTGASVGQSLVKILAHFDGVSLRPSGGIYWLPEHHVDNWLRVAAAVQECAEGDKDNKVYMLRTIMDDEAMRAVRDAIVAEVTTIAGALNDEIMQGGLGDRALESRKAQVMGLHQRVTQYETLLGETMNMLHQVLDTVEQAATVAALQAIAV